MVMESCLVKSLRQGCAEVGGSDGDVSEWPVEWSELCTV
jgi:hypothetical protein